MIGIIIAIIIVVIIAYAFFSKSVDNTMNNIGLNNEQKDNVWWTIGMMADIHNKNKDKK